MAPPLINDLTGHFSSTPPYFRPMPPHPTNAHGTLLNKRSAGTTRRRAGTWEVRCVVSLVFVWWRWQRRLTKSMSVTTLIQHQIFDKINVLRYLDVDSVIRLRWTCRPFFHHLDWVTISKLFGNTKIPNSIPHGFTRMQWSLGLIRHCDVVTGYIKNHNDDGYNDDDPGWWNTEGGIFDSCIVCIHEDGAYFDFKSHDWGFNKPRIFNSAHDYYQFRCPFTKGKFLGFVKPRNSRHIIPSSQCGRRNAQNVFAAMDKLHPNPSAWTVDSEFELAPEIYVESRGFECICYTLRLVETPSKKFRLALEIYNLAYYAS